jgi:hypothetical protein
MPALPTTSAPAPPVVSPVVPPVVPAVSRQVRRAATRQARRHARRQAVHAGLAPLSLAPATSVLAIPVLPAPAPDQPLYEALLTWLEALLASRGHHRPTVKRLALLGAGLLAPAGDQGAHGSPAGVAHTAFGLGIGAATQEASVARRVARLLDDPQLDPERLLPDLTRALLPGLLADVERAHTPTISTTTAHADHARGHHGRWIGVRVVIDETTKADGTHVLVVGLAYRGLVVPLALRTWPQNVPLPEGAYWDAVGAALWAVHAALPPVLRAHVLVLADRGYGVPAFLDLLTALGWQWLVRVQGQTRLRFPDGTERPLRALVPAPGTAWTGYTTPPASPASPASPAPLAVFKQAGWRSTQVVAVWATGQEEPWLLVTSLRATATRWRDYAGRWAIERLFLSWKSHGWDLEAGGVTAPARLARLLVGYCLATWWLLAAALPGAQAHLADLASRAARRTGRPPARTTQLRLSLFPLTRPWIAKFSLLTQGQRVFARTACRTATPTLCWSFPDWDAPIWSQQCLDVFHARAT